MGQASGPRRYDDSVCQRHQLSCTALLWRFLGKRAGESWVSSEILETHFAEVEDQTITLLVPWLARESKTVTR